MNTKKFRYLIATTFFVLAFLLFLDFTSCLNGPHCTFHGLEVFGYIFYPAVIFILGSAGLVFIALALVYKRKPENGNVAPQNIMYKSINPIVLGIGIAMFVAGFSYVKYPELYKGESNEVDLVEDIDDTNVSFKINPKDYSLVDYPLKQSPIYDQLDRYCSDAKEESGTIQIDTRLIKNGNAILIPSLRELIFANENQKPDCVTKISMFSAPTNGNYLYLVVSKLSFKEHSSWPIYRSDLLNLSIKKLSYIDTGGSIRIKEGENFIGFLDNNGTLLPDGKRLVNWDERSVYLVNLETDSKRILYTAPQNQWLVSNVNPQDVIGKFFDADIKIEGNNVVAGVYDKNKTFAKNPPGYHDYDINYELVNRITIPIPDSQ